MFDIGTVSSHIENIALLLPFYPRLLQTLNSRPECAGDALENSTEWLFYEYLTNQIMSSMIESWSKYEREPRWFQFVRFIVAFHVSPYTRAWLCPCNKLEVFKIIWNLCGAAHSDGKEAEAPHSAYTNDTITSERSNERANERTWMNKRITENRLIAF